MSPVAAMPTLHAIETSGADRQVEPVSAQVIPTPSMSMVSEEGTGTVVEMAEATDKEEGGEEKGKEKRLGKHMRIIKLLRQLCKKRTVKNVGKEEKR